MSERKKKENERVRVRERRDKKRQIYGDKDIER
jgi:hypothetical protein